MAKKTKAPLDPIVAADPNAMRLYKAEQERMEKEEATGEKQPDGILNMLLKSIQSHEQVQRMAFEVDPIKATENWGSLYRVKTGLVPDQIIKRITGPQGDDLVCQILQARSNIMGSFGRPRTSRFSVGFQFDEIGGDKIPEDSDQYDKLKERVDRVKNWLWHCGEQDEDGKSLVDDEYFTPSFSQLIKMITRDGLAYGRWAVEKIYRDDPKTGKRVLAAIRPVDAGTIYRITPRREEEQSTRKRAIQLLSSLKNEKISAEKYEQDEYRWVQVPEGGTPIQAFSEDELIVYNLYPVTNIEFNGYPLTPIDQALNAIVTHISITLHNKLYFQHGRAARGMLILSSGDADEGTVQKIKMQFHQSINSVQNSWRMPVFLIGQEDELSWQSIDVTGRDAEFQYLSDNNARVILSAFQMSPEELPGYAHLARGTNTQALAEADNEWKLTAARDVGLRPLMADMQDFFNTHIIPELDKEIASKFRLVFAGLEQDNPEKESTRIAQDLPLHMTMNDVLEKVEKDKLDKQLGADLPLNPQFHQLVLSPYLTVGEILENFMGREGAAKDPRYAYYRDPLWLQWQQILLQKTQMTMQNQMMQQQQMAQQQAEANGEPPPEEEQADPNASDTEKAEVAKRNLQKREAWLAQNYQLLEKGIKNNHNEISKMILARHKEITDKAMAKWKAESKSALAKIKNALKEDE